jgi:hypothetical protein
VARSFAGYLDQDPDLYLTEFLRPGTHNIVRLLADGALTNKGIQINPLAWQLEQMSRWAEEENCLIVRFEDLVGSQGNGSDVAQYESIKEICEHLGIEARRPEISALAASLFGGTHTFSRGKIVCDAESDDEQWLLETCRDEMKVFGY